jgi:hypothetical protein
MVILTQNTTSNASFTLGETTTISNPTYLFEFENVFTKDKFYIIPTEVVSNERYNEFSFDLTEEGVELEPVGWFRYNVYQQTSTTNLDPELSQGIVESGKMLLREGEEKEVENFTYVSDNEYNSNYVYVSVEDDTPRRIWGETHITFGSLHEEWGNNNND